MGFSNVNTYKGLEFKIFYFKSEKKNCHVIKLGNFDIFVAFSTFFRIATFGFFVFLQKDLVGRVQT
jgi:hypothetical protein